MEGAEVPNVALIDVRGSGRDGVNKTASCGATLNYTLADQPTPLSMSDVQESLSSVRSMQPRCLRYPKLPKEYYYKTTCPDMRRNHVPWATNIIAATGKSHTHTEYNAQANEDFRHYLKKAYRRLNLQSNLSECTNRTGDSDPTVPEYVKRKRLITTLATKLTEKKENIGPVLAAPPEPHLEESPDILSPKLAIPLRIHYPPGLCPASEKAVSHDPIPEVVHDNAKNSYWPKTVASVRKERSHRRLRTSRTSLCAVWSEEQQPQKRYHSICHTSQYRLEGKKLLKAPANPRGIVSVSGFDNTPPKPLKKRWSREAINLIMKTVAREEQRCGFN